LNHRGVLGGTSLIHNQQGLLLRAVGLGIDAQFEVQFLFDGKEKAIQRAKKVEGACRSIRVTM